MYVCMYVYIPTYITFRLALAFVSGTPWQVLRLSHRHRRQSTLQTSFDGKQICAAQRFLAKLGIKLQPQVKAMPKAARAKVLASRRRGKLWQLAVDEHKVLAKKYAIQEEISLVQQKLAEVQEQKALVRLMLSEAEQEQQ